MKQKNTITKTRIAKYSIIKYTQPLPDDVLVSLALHPFWKFIFQ